MTRVHFHLTDPMGVGLSGCVALTPTRRVTTDSMLRLPIPVRVPLAGGEATVDVLPSSTQWVWRVSELVAGGTVRFVAIPDTDTVVEYAGLEDIDPRSLDVDSATLAAWEAATRQAQAALDGIRDVSESVARAESAATDAESALAEAKAFDLRVGEVRVADNTGEAGASVHGDWPSKLIDMILPRGPKGETGEPGAAGVPGPQGVPGERGDPFTFAKIYDSKNAMDADLTNDSIPVGAFVMISTGSIEDPENATMWVKSPSEWTFITDLSGATGLQGPQGIQGIQGPKGDPGEKGADGADGVQGLAATVHVGDVTTGEPGTPAVVENTGSPQDAVFAFTIPQGAKGDKGDPGEKGADGKDGVQIREAATLEEGLALSAEHPDDFIIVLEEATA